MFRKIVLPKIHSPSARVKVFLVSVMALVVPLSAYFSLHVSSRTKYYKDRNFRQLSNFSRQISERIDNLGIAFRNMVDKFVRENEASKSDLQKPFQASLNILKTEGTSFTATTAILKEKPKADPTQKVDADVDLGLPVTISLVHQDGALWLYFDRADAAGKIHFAAKTDFEQLIRPLINQTAEAGLTKSEIADAFDHVIVARADNSKVLFESANDDLTLSSLDNIPLADASDKNLDLKSRSKATDSIDVTVAGARYKLYAQPIDIALQTKDSKDEETLWVICGLVDASRFRYQTWAISHTVLIVSGFFAGLLILSWPFLKLIFIGPKDRLRAAETLLLAVSVVIASSLVTFFFLFGLTYLQVEHKLDRQLFDLAGTFQQNFQTEVGNALKQIDILDCTRIESDGLSEPESLPGDDELVRTNFLRDMCPRGKCIAQDNPYPYFKTIFWVDKAGLQLAKWSINAQATKKIRVRNRDYFNKIQNGYYRELNGQKFWLEPVNSRITGNFTVAISKETYPDPTIKASVVVLDTDLMSLTKPALVSGFGYRIIDANGDVIFPNVKENFFAESENDGRLRSAVSGHLSDFISVPHLGRDSRVYVTPLAGIPDWTLVVFRDKEPLRSSYSEIVTLSAALFVIYLAPLLLLLAILFLRSLYTGKRMTWMWPSAGAAASYLQSIPVSLLLILVTYVVSTRLSSSATIVVVLSLISFTALLLWILSVKHNWKVPALVKVTDKLEQKPSKINHRSLYSVSLIMLLFLIAIFPSVTFFRLAYNEEMELFIKYGQVTLVNSLSEREQRIRSAYPVTILGGQNASETFVATRLKETFDRYQNFFFATGTETITTKDKLVAGVTPDTVLSELRKNLPFSNPTTIIRHGLVDGSADGLWQWPNESATRLTMLTSQGMRDTGLLQVASDTESFSENLATLLGFAAVMVVLLYLLLWFIRNRVFLVDTVEVTEPDAKASARKLFVVLGSPYTRREERFLPVADSEVLNLQSQYANSEWLNKLNLDRFLQKAASKPIAVEGFEYQIEQPQYNLQKLSLLEKLVNYKGEVVITSTAEPADYLFNGNGHGHAASGNHHISDAGARWAKALSNFWIDYREDKGKPETLQTEITAAQAKSKTNKDLYDVLFNECSPRAPLQQIGIKILERRDFEKSCAEDLISDVLLQAETYYQLIWDSCSPGEKVTLAHLAMDGFLSVNDPDVQRLVRRGLIVRDQEVRLLNESFSQFVLMKSGTDKAVSETEGQARKTSSWQYTKVALSVMVVGIMVFLFATQRDLYNSTLVALTSLAAGVPAVFNFFNLFQRGASAPSSSPPTH